MIGAYLDPYLFASPGMDEGPQSLDEYIACLLGWFGRRQVNPATLLTTERAHEILWDVGAYPLWEPLAALLRRYGREDVQARDLIAVVNSLLEKTLAIENELGVSDILVEVVEFNAPQAVESRSGRFREELERLIALTFMHREHPGCRFRSQYMVTRGVDGCATIEFTADVIECEGDGCRLCGVPGRIGGTLNVLSDLPILCGVLDPADLLVIAENEDQLRVAINVALQQRVGMDSAQLQWNLGRQFFGSIVALGVFRQKPRARAFLRACCDTILGDNRAATHWLRVGAGPEEPQIHRGHDGAWRRDIDYDYHLHYWSTRVGPELASVVIHADMTIPP